MVYSFVFGLIVASSIALVFNGYCGAWLCFYVLECLVVDWLFVIYYDNVVCKLLLVCCLGV